MSGEKTGFSVEEIERIAGLSSLELTQAEKDTFAKQFGEILAYFRKIAAVPTPSTDSSGGAAALSNEGSDDGAIAPPRYREDRREPSGVSPGQFSSYLENEHFKVPRVIE